MANHVLESSFAVELRVAARLAMMLGGGHLAAQDELDLKSHLHTAFGVSDLLANTERAQSVAKEAEKARATLRTSTQDRLTDRADLKSKIEELETNVRTMQARSQYLEDQRDLADRTRTLVERHTRHEKQQRLYQQSLSELLTQTQTVLTGDAALALDSTAIADAFRTAHHVAESQTRQAAEHYARAKGALSAAEEGLHLLHGDRSRCPTCMRPITSHELKAARASHKQLAQAATSDANKYSVAEAGHRDQSATIAGLLNRIEALEAPAPIDPDDQILDASTAQAAYESVLDALRTHNQELGANTSPYL